MILIKAGRLDKPADSVRGLERALQTALDFLQKQTSQSYAHRVLMGDSLAAKFKELQSDVENQLQLLQAETLQDVAGGVQELGRAALIISDFSFVFFYTPARMSEPSHNF